MYADELRADCGNRLVDNTMRPPNTAFGSESAATGRATTDTTRTTNRTVSVRPSMSRMLAKTPTASADDRADRGEPGAVGRVAGAGPVDARRHVDGAPRKRAIDLGDLGLRTKRVEGTLHRRRVAAPYRSGQPQDGPAGNDVVERTAGERDERGRRVRRRDADL